MGKTTRTTKKMTRWEILTAAMEYATNYGLVYDDNAREIIFWKRVAYLAEHQEG
jgi:hypothetical protein